MLECAPKKPEHVRLTFLGKFRLGKKMESCCLHLKEPVVRQNLIVFTACLLVATSIAIVLFQIRETRYKFLTSSTDEAIYTQLAYNFSHGKFFKSTAIPENRVSGEATFFAVHTAPSYPFFFAPYFVWPNYATIGYWQIIFILAGFIPICLIAFFQRQQPWITFALATSYLLSPFLLTNALWTDPTTFCIPLIFWIYFFYISEAMWPFFLTLIFFLGFEESMAPFVIAFGLWMIFRKDYRRGGYVFALGILWFTVCVFWIGKTFSEQGIDQMVKVFPLDRSPLGFIHALTNGPTWKNFFLMQLPFFFFPLLSWQTYFYSSPFMALFLLSPYQLFYSLTSRYAIPLLPIFIIGTLNFSKRMQSARTSHLIAAGLLTFAFFQHVPQFSLGEFNCFSPVRAILSHTNDPAPNDYRDLREKIFAHIPPDAKVVASHKLAHFLSERSWVHIFPYFWKEADILIIDRRYPHAFPFPAKTGEFYDTLTEIKKGGIFVDIFQSDSFLVLKNIHFRGANFSQILQPKSEHPR